MTDLDPARLPDDVVDITHDSRQVRPGWWFACVRGEQVDGHTFAAEAVERGATGLLVERRLAVDVDQIVVPDVRSALGPVAAAVHGHPSTRLRMVGITGTNGKTTTTHLLGAILEQAGLGHREIGTLSGARTTPEAPDLQRQLARHVHEGVEAVVMEVSSHALELHRVDGVEFDVGVFTNLGRDHLDLHDSMESYFRAKARLFTADRCRVGVTNLDDPYGRLLRDGSEIDMVGYSIDDASSIDVGVDRLGFEWRGRSVELPVGGAFNVMNALAALTAADVLGVDPADAVEGLHHAPPVPGRFEVVGTELGFAVVVDYAHTPDGLGEVLSTARELAGAGRVIVVFGCGGDRDAEKRPLMGAVAADRADVVVLTSDNPRHEDPDAIIAAALAGVPSRSVDDVLTVPDRRLAIARALDAAGPGDVVVIAGKGHEVTQTIGDVAHPFDDRVVAREHLDQIATGGTT